MAQHRLGTVGNAHIVAGASAQINTVPKTSQLEALESMAMASESRDPSVAKHNQRVGYLSAMMGEKLGLPDAEVELLRHAAPLHDIGTLFIPESILYKPSRLMPEEFELVKTHVSIGSNILQQGRNDLLKMAQIIVETHHERFDGSGYPYGLKGVSIPLWGQIVAVADVFDTLVHDQPYRAAWSTSKAVNEIKGQAGHKFDPFVVEAFLKVAKEQRWGSSKALEKPKVLIKGKLGAVSLFDMMTSFTQNGQSCKFYVYTGYSKSLLLFFEGRLVHAEVDELVGEAAVAKLAQKVELRPDAKFTVEAWEAGSLHNQRTSIQTTTEKLLLNIAVSLDHQQLKKAS